MRLLLVTDTHGDLDQVDDLARRTRADAVLHAGDLGFYDDDSVQRLTERELVLKVTHSRLPQARKQAFLRLPGSEKIEFVRRQCPLSDLPAYLAGRKRFEAPVYAVWGNHEDHAVVQKFRTGEYAVENLFALSEQQSFHLGQFHIFGLGGNVVMNPKFFQAPLSGAGGKIWSTFPQYMRLLDLVERNSRTGDIRLFVSHVSPGKEPFVGWIGGQTGADFLISGHMDPPLCMLWNEFAISEPHASDARMSARLDEIIAAGKHLRGRAAEQLRPDLDRLEQRVAQGERGRRGGEAPAWYRRMFYINLPDASGGYAIVTDTDGRLEVETHSHGFRASVSAAGTT